jgi:DNA polymerase-3 subunit delta
MDTKGLFTPPFQGAVIGMPEISYKEFNQKLSQSGSTTAFDAAVFLLFGDEFLYKKILEKLLPILLPGDDRSMGHVPMAGSNENIPNALSELNTYSLIPGNKVVVFSDASLFHSKDNRSELLAKARENAMADKLKQASRYFMGYLAFSGMIVEDLDQKGPRKRLEADLGESSDEQWMDRLIAYCREKKLAPGADRDPTEVLNTEIQKGFPKGHRLIITTELVDKRKKLYKLIRDGGIIVDCATPKGERRADKMAQEAILREHMQNKLALGGKTMDPKAFHEASSMTGFDLRSFSGNLDKLIDFVGDRKRITVEDVRSVVKRTKSDPIFEFTNALLVRDLKKSLFFLNSLFSQNFAALQILAAMINQVRKLLVARDFLDSPRGEAWSKGMTFNQFKSAVLPVLKAHDDELAELVLKWDGMLRPPSREGKGELKQAAKASKKTKGKQGATELTLVKNPRSPYPVYLLLKRANGFTQRELLDIFRELNQADRMLKSSPLNPRLVLEKAIFPICTPQVKRPKGAR